jgi:AAA+ superfamily predicted ATPase
MNAQAVEDPVTTLAALAAARLALRLPEPDLTDLFRGLLPDGPPKALSAAIAAKAAAIFDEMDSSSHPLARIARGCGLSAFDIDLLGLALLPCVDDRAASLMATLNDQGRRRLSAGAGLRVLIGDGPVPARARRALWTSPLWRHGLLVPAEPRQPANDWPLDASATLAALLDGVTPELLAGDWRLRPRPTHLPAPSQSQAVAATRGWLDQPDSNMLQLAGEVGRAELVLSAACAEADREIAVFESAAAVSDPPWRELALIALATDGAAAVAAAEAAELVGPPEDLVAPAVLLAPSRLHVRARAGARPAARVVLPRPSPLEQAKAWRDAMVLTPAEADELGNQTWMSHADISAIASRARSVTELSSVRLALAPPRPVRMATVHMPQVPWERLIVDEATAARLEDLLRRYRQRVPVRFRWGLDQGALGLVALLAGDSGVGKTLTAEAIAARLGLPLMRVDLSLVVSKYIGETEKNLSELFAAAEGFAALLFFDEADALFGKRTAVEDAHDRYANIEVNYLLQRLEAFEGFAVLATNLAQGVDDAFTRRFDLMIPMPRPGPGQRLRLWRAHLPGDRIGPGIDLPAVAERFAMTGGEIRNAALAAAYAAADEPAGEGLITPAQMQAAIAAEFAKKGRPPPGWPTGDPK